MKNNSDLAGALVLKAANDFRMAEIGLQHDAPLDTISFHLQQVAEKLLKALLASQGTLYPRTHDIEALLDLAIPRFPLLERFREQILGLTSYAVEMRYDAIVYPDRHEVLAAYETVVPLRNTILELLSSEAV
jgi:HEPN domain-containing protein